MTAGDAVADGHMAETRLLECELRVAEARAALVESAAHERVDAIERFVCATVEHATRQQSMCPAESAATRIAALESGALTLEQFAMHAYECRDEELINIVERRARSMDEESVVSLARALSLDSGRALDLGVLIESATDSDLARWFFTQFERGLLGVRIALVRRHAERFARGLEQRSRGMSTPWIAEARFAALVTALVRGDSALVAQLVDSVRDEPNDDAFVFDEAIDIDERLTRPMYELWPVDRRDELARMLLYFGEVELARPWIDRVMRVAGRTRLGESSVECSLDERTLAALRASLTPEQWLEFEQRAFEILVAREPTPYEWESFARWATIEHALIAAERAAQRFEADGSLIRAAWLPFDLQRRVTFAAVERWSAWVEEFDAFVADASGGFVGELASRVDTYATVDLECVERSWPTIARLVHRSAQSSHGSLRVAVKRWIEAAATRGFAPARELIEEWQRADAATWSKVAMPDEPAPEEFNGTVANLREWFSGLDANSAQRIDWNATRTHSDARRWAISREALAPRDADELRSVLARMEPERRALWIESQIVQRGLRGELHWAAADEWSKLGFGWMASRINEPFGLGDGPHSELVRYWQSRPAQQASRWSYSSEVFVEWFEHERALDDRSWLIEPGARSLVARFAGVRERLLARCFDEAAELLNVDGPEQRTLAALNELLPWAKSHSFDAYIESVRRWAREGRIAVEQLDWSSELLCASHFGTEVLQRVSEALGIELIEGEHPIWRARCAMENHGSILHAALVLEQYWPGGAEGLDWREWIVRAIEASVHRLLAFCTADDLDDERIERVSSANMLGDGRAWRSRDDWFSRWRDQASSGRANMYALIRSLTRDERARVLDRVLFALDALDREARSAARLTA